jgi:hypothetical protein
MGDGYVVLALLDSSRRAEALTASKRHRGGDQRPQFG